MNNNRLSKVVSDLQALHEAYATLNRVKATQAYADQSYSFRCEVGDTQHDTALAINSLEAEFYQLTGREYVYQPARPGKFSSFDYNLYARRQMSARIDRLKSEIRQSKRVETVLTKQATVQQIRFKQAAITSDFLKHIS